jgi:hypothetical protein
MSDADNLVMWPFLPNWRNGVTSRYQFKTSMFVSEDGTEQRSALRSTPRRSISYSALVAHGDLRTFNRIVDTAQNLPMVCADYSSTVSSLASIANGATQIAVDFVPSWLAVGALIVIAGEALRLAEVSAVDGNQVTLATAPGPLSAGTHIHQALVGRLPEALSTRRITSAVAEIAFEFDVDPVSTPFNFGIAGEMFGGFELLPARPNWARPIDTTHNWPIEIVDYDRGRVTVSRPIDFGSATRTIEALCFDQAAADTLVAFFGRMRGRRGTFVAPTYESDMDLAINVSSGATSLTVIGTDVYHGYAGDPVKTAIEISLTNGTLLRRGITTVTQSGGNSVLSLSAGLPAISTQDIARISWLTRARLGSDELVLEWITDRVCRTSLSIVTLPESVSAGGELVRATLDSEDRQTLENDTRTVFYL